MEEETFNKGSEIVGSSQLEYGRHSIEALLKQNPICICPLVVCTIKRAVVRSNLQEDKETRVALAIEIRASYL